MKKLTIREQVGRVRPARGPYPKGVANGPLPRTERGIRRRKKNMSNVPRNNCAFENSEQLAESCEEEPNI